LPLPSCRMIIRFFTMLLLLNVTAEPLFSGRGSSLLDALNVSHAITRSGTVRKLKKICSAIDHSLTSASGYCDRNQAQPPAPAAAMATDATNAGLPGLDMVLPTSRAPPRQGKIIRKPEPAN
jgi:hypothetical protein